MTTPTSDIDEAAPRIGGKSELVEYLEGGNKPKTDWRIGTEHEKFGFRLDDLRPPPFEGPQGIRAVLEGTAARLAARAASDVELSELVALNDDFAACGGDPLRASAANRRFHRALQDAAKNRFLARALDGLEKTLLILGPSTLSDPDRSAAAVQEHAAILAALSAHDGAAAEAAMRSHIEAAQRARLKSLRDMKGES